MAQRATSIGPKPSLFVLFCFWFVFVCFVLVVGFCLFFWFWLLFYLEGFTGQVRWPFGPPHLTLKPSLVVFVVCFCVCVGMNQKTLFFTWKRFFFLPLSSVWLPCSVFFFSFLLSFFLSYTLLTLFCFFPSCFLSLFPSLFLPFCFLLSFLLSLIYCSLAFFLCLSFFSLFPCCFPVLLFSFVVY